MNDTYIIEKPLRAENSDLLDKIVELEKRIKLVENVKIPQFEYENDIKKLHSHIEFLIERFRSILNGYNEEVQRVLDDIKGRILFINREVEKLRGNELGLILQSLRELQYRVKQLEKDK